MYLLLCFVTVALLVFSAIAWSTKPSRAVTATELRLQSLLVLPQGKQSGKQPAQAIEKKPSESFPWVEERLRDTALLRHCSKLLLQSQCEWSAGGLIVSMAMLASVPPLLLFLATQNPVLSVPAIACAMLPYLWLRWKRARRVADFEQALPRTLEMFARSLRAGHSIPVAIATLAEEAAEPCRLEFAEVHRDQSYGLPMRDALLSMLERVPSRDLRVFVTGVLVQKDTGGNLPEVLDRIVAVLRDRVRIQREIRTHTAQGRLTGWILCLLPPALLLLINLMNPHYSQTLFDDPMGRKLLYTGVALLAMGAFSIRHIVRGIEV